jgi:hypothetical protein
MAIKRERVFAYVLLGVFVLLMLSCLSITLTSYFLMDVASQELSQQTKDRIEAEIVSPSLKFEIKIFRQVGSLHSYMIARTTFVAACWLIGLFIVVYFYRKYIRSVSLYNNLVKESKKLF